MSNNSSPQNQQVTSLYQQYKADPKSVDKSWAAYFAAIDKTTKQFNQRNQLAFESAGAGVANYAAIQLVDNFRNYGHLIADLDPLNSWIRNSQIPFLLSDYGFTADQAIELPFPVFKKTSYTAGELINKLKSTYSGSLAINVTHIADSQVRSWFFDQLENHPVEVSNSKKLEILEILTKSNNFERIIGSKFTGAKRFSIEGVDSMLVLLREIIAQSAANDLEHVAIGMAHRGRLNALVNICGMNPKDILDAFAGVKKGEILSPNYTGDVKYHQGFTALHKYKDKELNVHLCYNPSHLEIVGPVALGKVRAIQDSLTSKKNFDKAFAIIIHGDSAVSGQGVNQETLNLANTRGFTTGGTIHLVTNNQVGFTTHLHQDVRSSIYSSDIAKFTDCPIIYVNSEDPEAVYHAAKLAFAYRSKFHRDIFVEIIGYRRHGHNEADDPGLTQPLMYKIIRKLGTPSDNYAKKLIDEQLINQEEYYALNAKIDSYIDQGNNMVEELVEQISNQEWLDLIQSDNPTRTNLKLDSLIEIAKDLNQLPDGIGIHNRVAKIYQSRFEMSQPKAMIDWGFAENLAYATLLKDGISIRLTGEDVGRGTFAHRHAVIHNQEDGSCYVPCSKMIGNKGSKLQIWDSTLSEEAVMAYEYGYSIIHNSCLTIWEAQFGDFANTAQVVIDQFLSSGKQKWNNQSNLVLLLPHGYEGQGPEHSSARIERYLQLCAQDNMSVAVPSTPAQIYHLLRRQAYRQAKVPLIAITPKSLLRNPDVASPIETLAKDHFQVLIDDRTAQAEKTTRLVFLSGKIYYDIKRQKDKLNLDHIALVRIEELYPLPDQEIKEVLKKYSHVKDIIWTQEEPKNQGAWNYIALSFLENFDIKLKFIGNSEMAATAVGYLDRHNKDHQKIIDQVLEINSANN